MLKPYYETKEVKIYHGDCREILPYIGSVDLVVTDPPYMLPHVQFRAEMREQTRTWGNFSPARAAFDEYLRCLWRLGPSEMYWFLDEISYPVMFPSLYLNSYSVKLLVWNKARIGMGGKWRRSFELIAYVNDDPISQRSGRADILTEAPVRSTERQHPFQKPLPLVRALIDASPGARTVIDPFMGVGTTLLAARAAGRRAIGIEIEEQYCELAANHLRLAGLHADDHEYISATFGKCDVCGVGRPA